MQVLTTITYKFTIIQLIPAVSYLTLLDLYVFFCFICIVVFTVEGPIVGNRELVARHHQKMTDRYCGVSFFAIGVAFHMWFGQKAYKKRQRQLRQLGDIFVSENEGYWRDEVDLVDTVRDALNPAELVHQAESALNLRLCGCEIEADTQASITPHPLVHSSTNEIFAEQCPYHVKKCAPSSGSLPHLGSKQDSSVSAASKWASARRSMFARPPMRMCVRKAESSFHGVASSSSSQGGMVAHRAATSVSRHPTATEAPPCLSRIPQDCTLPKRRYSLPNEDLSSSSCSGKFAFRGVDVSQATARAAATCRATAAACRC
eukprot:5502216-Prymnesium_polylepis.2